MTKGIDTSIRAYGQGPYSALFRYRAKELARNYGATLAASGHILAMFLLGAWTHRRGILKDVAAHRTFLRRLMWVSLPSGLALNVFYLWAIRDGMGPKNIDSLLGMAAYFVGAPLLTLAYVAIVALAHAGAGLGLLRLLAPVGRMALTNYLTQSLAGTTIFYFYGFGLYDRVPLPGMLALAFLIWCVQLPVSKIWLRYFSMGPAEWLWRALSYRKAPAFLAAR